MSIWKEIKCIHFHEEEQKWFVDAWLTGGDTEEGKVIAKLDLQCGVEYIDERAKTDTYAQEIIEAIRFDILAGRVYDLYINDWCVSRGYDSNDYDVEHGFNGESFVCFDEFLDAEFKDEEYVKRLLGDGIDLWLDIINKQQRNPPVHTDKVNPKNTIKRKIKTSLGIIMVLTQIVCLICISMDFYRPIAFAVIVLMGTVVFTESAVKNHRKKNKIVFVMDIAFILFLFISGIVYLIC